MRPNICARTHRSRLNYAGSESNHDSERSLIALSNPRKGDTAMGFIEDFVGAHVDVATDAAEQAIDDTIDELTGANNDDNDNE